MSESKEVHLEYYRMFVVRNRSIVRSAYRLQRLSVAAQLHSKLHQLRVDSLSNFGQAVADMVHQKVAQRLDEVGRSIARFESRVVFGEKFDFSFYCGFDWFLIDDVLLASIHDTDNAKLDWRIRL